MILSVINFSQTSTSKTWNNPSRRRIAVDDDAGFSFTYIYLYIYFLYIYFFYLYIYIFIYLFIYLSVYTYRGVMFYRMMCRIVRNALRKDSETLEKRKASNVPRNGHCRRTGKRELAIKFDSSINARSNNKREKSSLKRCLQKFAGLSCSPFRDTFLQKGKKRKDSFVKVRLLNRMADFARKRV